MLHTRTRLRPSRALRPVAAVSQELHQDAAYSRNLLGATLAMSLLLNVAPASAVGLESYDILPNLQGIQMSEVNNSSQMQTPFRPDTPMLEAFFSELKDVVTQALWVS